MQRSYREDDDSPVAVSHPLERMNDDETITSSSLAIVQQTDSSETGSATMSQRKTSTTNTNSATEEERRLQSTSRRDSSGRPKIYKHLTTLSQIFIFLFLMIIASLSFVDEFDFFTWHPFLLSIGWMFFMYQAVLVMSKDNVLTAPIPKFMRVRLHWISQTFAVSLIMIGLIIAIVNKNYWDKAHFNTWHGTIGIIAILALIAPVFNGILSLYHNELRDVFKPKTMKYFHICAGIISLFFGGLALLLGIYSKWFQRRTSGSLMVLSVALILVVYSVVWTMVRPFLTCYKHFVTVLN